MESDEFSTARVPPDRSVAWWKICLINVLFSFSLPSLIAGMDLGNAAPRSNFVPGLAVGCLILTAIAVRSGRSNLWRGC